MEWKSKKIVSENSSEIAKKANPKKTAFALAFEQAKLIQSKKGKSK